MKKLSLRTAETLEEVMALRESWVSMQSGPDADLDFYLTLFETRPNFIKPYVIALQENERTTAILVGRVEQIVPAINVGYAALRLPSLRCLTIIGSGLLGEPREDGMKLLVGAVTALLRSGGADAAWFHRLDINCILQAELKQAETFLSRDYFPVINDNWITTIPHSYDEFLNTRSSGQRHNLKRYKTRLLQTYEGKVFIDRFTEVSQIDTLMADTERIAKHTYHRGINAGFLDDPETRARMYLYARQHKLLAYILYIDGMPIAFWNGFHYGTTFYTWTTGFDSAYAEVRPGMFLLQHLLRDLCASGTTAAVDFGSGDALYKRELCDLKRQEISIYLFAPTFKGVMTNLLRTPLLASASGARWAIARSQVLAPLKRLWRARLKQRPALGSPTR